MSNQSHLPWGKTGGRLFDIKRYAINDGPGIRTTIFIKGCPLRCIWCHDPEGWLSAPQKLYKQSKCIGCRTCIEVCPQHALELTPDGVRQTGNLCMECGRCAEECPTTALEICGREWPMDALMAEIEKERLVMEDSGGGVTLCGGEPLMHPDYALDILRELGRRGFHRCVDTTLYAPRQVVADIAAHCDLFLVDLKLMDSDLHRRYTGVPNELILQNIRFIASEGTPFRIRIPLIEGINADEANIEATARFIASLPSPSTTTVHLLPYHDMGREKHRRMLRPSGGVSVYNPQNIPMSTPTEEVQQRCAHQLEAHGLHVVIGG